MIHNSDSMGRDASAETGRGAAEPIEFNRGSIVVLAASFVGAALFINAVFNNSLSAFMKDIAADTGWSRGQISAGIAVAMGGVLVMLPVAGWAGQKFGLHKVVAAGAPIFAMGLAGLGWAQSYPAFLALCLVLGIGGAGTYLPIYSAILARFFVRHLGLALGISAAGSGIGVMMGPLVGHALVDSFGWRNGFVALALGTLAVHLAVIAALFAYPPPPVRVARHGEAGEPKRSKLMIGAVALAYFITAMAIAGVIVHLISLLTDRGMAPRDAAIYASYIGMTSLLTRVLVGLVLDHPRADAGLMGALAFSVLAAGMLLMASSPAPGVELVAVVLVGVALGAEADILPYVTRAFFGARNFPKRVAAMSSVFTAGSLTGPLVAGVIYDQTGSYAASLYFFGFGALLAAALHAPATIIRPKEVAGGAALA